MRCKMSFYVSQLDYKAKKAIVLVWQGRLVEVVTGLIRCTVVS